MTPLVVSFYTNELYGRLASRLAHSCEAFGLDHDIRAREARNDWISNCAQKPLHILEMLNEHDRDLLWVDADAEFVSEPVGLDVECDFAFFITAWHRYMSGTLLIRNTDASRSMVADWVACQSSRPGDMDEMTMRTVVEDMGDDLATVQLDPGYLYVFDIWPVEYPMCKPIVLHKMASRALIPKFHPDRSVIPVGVHPDVKEGSDELCS